MRHESRDRWSLEWMLEHGIPQGVVVAGAGFIWFGLPGALVGFVLGAAFTTLLGRLAGKFAGGIYAPSGASTAYVPTHSHIDALVIRGDLDGAAAAWEQELVASGGSVGVLVKAADFHLRERGDATRALELFQRAREASGAPADTRRYVQQKIVDIYLGPLKDEGRALVELRRLIDAFPGTREADAARGSLAAIKRDRERRDGEARAAR